MPLLSALPSQSVSTFVPSGTSLPIASKLSTPSASAGINMTQVVFQQAANQTKMNQSIPGDLLLAFGCLLVFCMLLAHPRFLARLFASSAKPKPKDAGVDYVFASANAQGGNQVDRVVGGGGLKEGWVLKRQSTTSTSTPTGSSLHDKNPFADPAHPSPNPTYFPPPHITPILQNLPFAGTLLVAPFSRLPIPFSSSITLSRLYIVFCYLVLVAVALIWECDFSPVTKTKGYGTNFVRPGFVAVAQIPVIVALGVRGNLLGLCVGMGYERMKVFHKVVGRTVFLCSTLHVGLMANKWVVAGTFTASASKPFAIAGLTAYSSIFLIALTALPWMRKACYGIFEVCHFVGMVGLLVGLAFHVNVAIPFCIAALVIYIISILSSLTKTRLAHAELLAFPDSSTTIVTIPTITTGWRAGQHVRLRVPALGAPHGFESHPFTIASAPDTEGLVLMCKNAGNWTSMLYELAAYGSGVERATSVRTASVLLEGPCGGLGNTLVPSFSSLLLVAGGSGISHALGLAHDLVTKASTGTVRARTIDLVWVVGTEGAARSVMPTLLDLVNDATVAEVQCLESRRQPGNTTRPTALRVKIYVTRCPVSSPLNLVPTDPFADDTSEILPDDSKSSHSGLRRQPSEAEKEKLAYLTRSGSESSTRKVSPLSSISATPGRPVFDLLVDRLAHETMSRHARSRTDPSGVCVTACGPRRMVDDVRRAVRVLDGEKKRRAGGVEVEEEFFGF